MCLNGCFSSKRLRAIDTAPPENGAIAPMMDGFGWMGGMGFGALLMLLILVLAVLAIAALVKYLSR